MLSLLYRE